MRLYSTETSTFITNPQPDKPKNVVLQSGTPNSQTSAPDRNVMCLVYPDGSITTVIPQPNHA
ncbi:MAG: hypothetical protein HC800_02980 [Phormidesmis sp. RL_2_1]|nr:hypothetical protein [Phormidesmis sp. RL_2_1]